MLQKFSKHILNKIDQPFFLFNKKHLTKQINFFCKNFDGTILYAVKANPLDFIINCMSKNGINSFDTASLDETRLIRNLVPNAEIFYMNPIKSRQSIKEAYFKYNVKNFALDSFDEMKKIIQETNYSKKINLHVRLKIHNKDALINISNKFGVNILDAQKLLKKITKYSSKIGLSFHVGSQCMNPDAFKVAMNLSQDIVKNSKVIVDYLNIGGGFPSNYPGLNPFPVEKYFETVNRNFKKLNRNIFKIKLLAEPGRFLVSESMSLVVKVELRKKNKLYVNDGIYGHLNNAGLKKFNYPVKLFNRVDNKSKLIPFSFFGPTCDSADFMKGPFLLPDSINEGDWIEIMQMGAYSTTMQTNFNGFSKKLEVFKI